MSLCELQKIDQWPEILAASAVVWALEKRIIKQNDVDRAYTDGPPISATVGEISDDGVALTLNILDNTYAVEYRMPVAMNVIRSHRHSQEQENGTK